MSITNEEIIEEIMWIAYEGNKAIELVELASNYMMREGLQRMDAYEKAFRELDLKLPDNT